jgi:hypothetical protein
MPNDKNAQSKNPVAKPAANSELKTDKQPKEKKGLLEGLNLRKRFSRAAAFVIRYQVVIMAVFVGGLLGITAIRMLHYANPTMNQALRPGPILLIVRTRLPNKDYSWPSPACCRARKTSLAYLLGFGQ